MDWTQRICIPRILQIRMNYLETLSDEELKNMADTFEYLPNQDYDERCAEVELALELFDICTDRGVDAERLLNEFKAFGFDLERDSYETCMQNVSHD